MAISPSELRIGNWYNEFGIPKIATPQLILRLYQIEIAGKIAIDVSPIHLTPEVLEKCPQVTKRDGYPYKILNGYIVNRADGKYIFKYYDIYVVLDYLHQLQNLYFALTNNELIYNP